MDHECTSRCHDFAREPVGAGSLRLARVHARSLRRAARPDRLGDRANRRSRPEGSGPVGDRRGGDPLHRRKGSLRVHSHEGSDEHTIRSSVSAIVRSKRTWFRVPLVPARYDAEQVAPHTSLNGCALRYPLEAELRHGLPRSPTGRRAPSSRPRRYARIPVGGRRRNHTL